MNRLEAARPTRRRSTMVVALLLALVTALFIGAGTTTANAKPRTVNPDAVPVTGTVADDPDTTANEAGTFAGTFDVSRFRVVDGALVAVGTLTGDITNTDSGATSAVNESIELPVNLAQTDGSCSILHLVLGPLDLDLLGLQVHLDQVVLDITAQSGPGNLLGNLLCAVAGLLDSNTGVSTILNQIANLLNQILGVLG